ncbi:MAG: hypothetical protein C0618_02390 [Desulfuromonas sp.]|nr:MAG: hypothetical protein C0618_02390 [Desulfuromonas sp.]
MSGVNSENQQNKLCLKCVRTCKQTAAMVMLDCPRFHGRPFKSEEHRFQQLDLFSKKVPRK